jgi:allophanate hydrolase
VDAFDGFYRLADLRRECEALLSGVDALCVPTIPAFVTLDEIAVDPIGPNARLGTYTNFVNLLDLCGIAVPTGERVDGRPGGVTLLARAGRDDLCASIACGVEAGRLGATGWQRPASAIPAKQAAASEIAVAVCGAHMSGLPLNRELTMRGGRLIRDCRTAPVYRLQASGRRGNHVGSLGAAARSVRRLYHRRPFAARHRHDRTGRRLNCKGLSL